MWHTAVDCLGMWPVGGVTLLSSAGVYHPLMPAMYTSHSNFALKSPVCRWDYLLYEFVRRRVRNECTSFHQSRTSRTGDNGLSRVRILKNWRY